MDLNAKASHSILQTTAIPTQASNSIVRDIIIVLMVSWAIRLAFMWVVPLDACSFDAFAWEKVGQLLNDGANPYQASVFISWPPLWMQLVFLISKASALFNVPFLRVLQIFLIIIESAVIVQVMRLIRTIAPMANVRAIAMIGIALNPVAILLVCQHCNFDVLMALWVLLAAESLLRYSASKDPLDWLCACLFLGIGVLTKTVPLALLPLLAGGFRNASAPGRLLGVALALGPATLGMSVIYVLAPTHVLHNVLEYRSTGTSFGFPGILHGMRLDDFAGWLNDAFYLLGIGIMVLTWNHLWEHHSLGNSETILYIAIVLLSVPCLGPGYATQYYYWFLPFLVISYACYGGNWRKVLVGFGLLSAIIFVIEYGLKSAYGYNFVYLLCHTSTRVEMYHVMMTGTGKSVDAARYWTVWMLSPSNLTMERIPLFIAMVTIILFGARLLLLSREGLRKWVAGLAGCYAVCVLLVFAVGIGSKCLWPGGSGESPSQTLPSP